MAWVSASSVTGLLTTASTPGGCSALAPIRAPQPVSMITDVSRADRSMVAATRTPHEDLPARARLALARQRPAVALDGGVHEREPEAGAVLALRREEGLQAALPDLVRHAGAGVADLESHLGAFLACAHRDRTALRHGVDRVEDQVGEHLPDPGRVPLDDRRAGDAGIDADRDALAEGLVLPARLRQGHHFVDAAAEVDRPVDGGLAPVAV